MSKTQRPQSQSSAAATDNLLLAPLSALKGVGPALADKLARLGLNRCVDLLLHFPLRYEDRSRLVPIAELQDRQFALTQGQIVTSRVQFSRGPRARRMWVLRLQHQGSLLTLRFFHFNTKQQQQLEEGVWLRVFGEVRMSLSMAEMTHPEYLRIDEKQLEWISDQGFQAVYPLTQGLTQARVRQLVEQLMEQIDRIELPDYLPAMGPKSSRFPALKQALQHIHHPQSADQLLALQQFRAAAQQRLIVEELGQHWLGLQRVRDLRKQRQARRLPLQEQQRQALLQTFGFVLTAAQQRVLGDIDADLQRGQPMLRLLQGDVGSGKTVVAAMACLHAVANGYQAVLMAPTEALALQHAKNFAQWFGALEIPQTYLCGSLKSREKKQVLEQIASGWAAIVIGTHALFQDDVQFAEVGLIVVDEQQRFGVDQRLKLHNKGIHSDNYPHQLLMTATPIPRTLAMTLYADLDYCILDERPPGRKPVQTSVMSDQKRVELIQSLQRACKRGEQVYWVCTLIDESESLQAQAAEAAFAELQGQLPEYRIGLMHGRLKAREKEQVMQQFSAAELDCLVATTVIEVGVDVPNASIMVIENAERLGLAQIHQLRGRVGRGTRQSHCILLYGEGLSKTAIERLEILRSSEDGFEIAEKDLELRGPGELLGTRQTGELLFRLADPARDRQLLPLAQQYADWMLENLNEAEVQQCRQLWLMKAGEYSQTA